MIYQLYYKNDYNTEPFGSIYEKFNLADIEQQEYLPEIQSEYCGMLYFWKNKIYTNKWIGFTSCRQISKGYSSIIGYSSSKIEKLLVPYDIMTWGLLCPKNTNFSNDGSAKNLYEQANYFHKPLLPLMNDLFNSFGIKDLIYTFKSYECGIFANYWLMLIKNYENFMDWSYPIVLYMIDHPEKFDTKTGHYNSVGYIIERMFIYWYIKHNKIIYYL